MQPKSDSLQLKHPKTGDMIKVTPKILSTLLPTHQADNSSNLQDPIQWIKFLNSPKGKALLAFIKEELALYADTIENRIRSQISAQTRKKIYSYLSTMLRSHRHDKSEEKSTSKTSIIKKAETRQSLKPSEISERLSTLEDAIYVIDEKLALKQKEQGALTRDLAAIQKQIVNVAKKYEAYDKFLLDAFHELQQMDVHEPMDWLQKRLHHMQQDIANGSEKLAALAEDSSGKEDAFQNEFSENFFHNLKYQMYNDLVFKLQKKKIVVHEGEKYLIHTEQSIKDLSVEHKDSAKEAYLQLTPKLIHRYIAAKDKQKEAEADYLGMKKLYVTNKFNDNQLVMDKLKHQKTLFRIEIKELQQQLEPQQKPANSYIRMLNSLNPPAPSRANLKRLQEAVKNNREISPDVKRQVALLQPAVPMTRDLWIQLMRFRPHLATSPQNANLMPPTGASSRKYDASEPFHPSPLSTKPKPP